MARGLKQQAAEHGVTYQKLQQIEWQLAGRCQVCGHQPATETRCCDDCAARHRARMRQRYAAKVGRPVRVYRQRTA